MNLMLIQVTNVRLVIMNFVRKVVEIFDNLENLKPSLSNEIKMALVYIAGEITRNDNQAGECENRFYYEKYGKYTNLIDRGKLKVPTDPTC